MSNVGDSDALTGQEIAIVGMSGRFPKARSVEEFWRNLRDGRDCISRFSDEELLAAGIPREEFEDPHYVRAQGSLDDVELFDAAFFGLAPREAAVLNPQHRLFLECAWEALENAGYDSETFAGRIGSFSGAELNGYWMNLESSPRLREGGLDIRLGNTTSNVATRVAYELNLEGPSLNVQTACSSSLVAVHLGVQSLLAGESDLVLAGGVSVSVPQGVGYFHQEGSPMSPNGMCRSYDADARGTVPGSGVGVVVLRRLEDALADGDTIHAVIRGSTVNNDGSAKIGYTAPRKDGQAKAILEAIALAGVAPDTITMIEGHGSATELGDPIEVEALTQAFRSGTDRTQFCALGSVKSNVGHLDSAAGITGLIKATLALEHGELPPSLHYERPNPKIDFAGSPFFVNTELRPWDRNGTPRRAGVSSFGMGGTNAHVVLEEAPEAEPSGPSRPWQLLVLSARTPAALEAATDRLVEHLKAHPEQPLADVAHTLRVGRRRFGQRRVLVCRDREEAIAALESRDPQRLLTVAEDWDGRGVVFLFPGLGDHYAQMARGLYEAEPAFRREVDRCAELLRPHLGSDVRQVLFPGEPAAEQRADAAEAPATAQTDLRRMMGRGGDADLSASPLGRTELAQPAVFVVEYALARTWMEWGVQPKAMIGHSLGEYVAATVAGVFSLEDALALVAERARLIGELPAGAMLAVPMNPAEVEPLLRDGLALGAHNAPGLCTVAGPVEAVAALEAELVGRGIACRRLAASHAFHSPMMDPVAERLAERVRGTKLRAPKVPFASNVTGTWITAEEATSPEYWTRHLCRTVRFAEGMEELLRDRSRVLLEVGPGRTLGTFALQAGATETAVLASLRHAYTRQADQAFLLETLGRLWMAGVKTDWNGFVKAERRHRIPLPTYPFERQRYWIELHRGEEEARRPARSAGPERRLHLPGWRRTVPAPRPAPGKLAGTRWLLFVDGAGLGAGLARRLEAAGADVVTVETGTGFAATGERAYRIRPGEADDYRALLAALRAANAVPGDVVHLWSVTGEAAATEPGSFRDAYERGYASLLLLARALEQDGAEATRIHLVADRLHEVTGAETVDPARAVVLGPCATLPAEFPGIGCRTVDVQLGPDGGRLAEHLLAEVASESADAVVALRGWRRWAQTPQRMRPLPHLDSPLREEGVYLFAGQLGEAALALAGYLAREKRARLVLLQGPDFPARESWDAYLVYHENRGPYVRVLGEVRALEVHTEVLTLAADPADPAAVAGALAQARERFGELHGVFYTQPLEPVGGVDPSGAEAHFRRLADRMAALEAGLEGAAPDFCLLQTWIPAGGTERTGTLAAAHLAAAVARRHAAEHRTPWTAVTWDRWQPVEAPWLVGPAERERMVAGWLQALERVLLATAEPEVRAGIRRPGARPDRASEVPALPSVTLHDRHTRPALPNPYVAPRNEAEERIAAVWQDMLEIDRVGIHDDFFALGGHSLYATQIISRVRDHFQVELSLQSIFEHPTVAGLTQQVEELSAAGATDVIPPIPRADRSQPLPLSYQQERMWVLDQLEPGNPFYNVSPSQRFIGRLDFAAAEQAFQEVVRRHEVLRTGYETVDGQPVQVIHEEVEVELRVRDLRHLPEAEREEEALRTVYAESAIPIDLRTPPPVRTLLIRMGDEDQILVVTFHHIAVDGWSGIIFFQEWQVIYINLIQGQPSPFPDLPVQYADYAVWQRKYVSGERLERQILHWQEHLRQAPAVLELPTDRPRPPFRTYNGGLFKPYVGSELKERLEVICQREGITLFILMIAVYKAQLYRYTGQEDLIVGTVEANRQREETERMIGFFINTLALRSTLRGEDTFLELFRQVRDVSLDAYANADLPLEKLLESLHLERDLSRNPLLQIMFGLERPAISLLTEEARDASGLERVPYLTTGLVDTGTTKFDLTYLLKDNLDHVGGVLEYNSDLFDEATVVRMWENYYHMLEQIADNPELRLREIQALSKVEREQLRSWNATTVEYPTDRLVHQHFAEQAARTPDAVAVAFAERRLGYAELDRRTNQLARALRARGVGPETRVGVCLERSPEMIVALVGILKSGGAFVPLDPAYPEDRLAYLLEDAAVPVLLTQERLLGRLPAHAAETLCLDRDWTAVAAESDAPVEELTQPETLAYVIYTSGSTGRPKGVRVQHGNLLNTLLACREAFDLRAGDVIPSLASYAFDIWLFEALGPLVSGGAVRVIPTERVTDMEALVEEIRDAGLLHAVPALMRQIVRAVNASGRPVPGVRRAFVGGDVVPADLWMEMRAAFPAAELWVLYGPTEGTILCTAHHVEDPSAVTRHLIGTPMANSRVYVCDEPGRLVPIGVPGELLLGGRGVTEGYLGRPDLTAEKFVPDPFSTEPGARLYRTGDRVRCLGDGSLEFQGRTDQQVKIRGYRMEPGEIESVLLRHPAVDGVVVMVREDEPGDRRLAAYLVPAAGARVPATAELREHIKGFLPEYMVPSAFVVLDEFPLSPTGKIDRGALPAPERGAEQKGYVAPRNPVEETLARVWAEVLRVERVGVHDNFFELGGDSILSIQVVARAHRAGVQLKPRYFFEHPTIAELAPLAGSAAASEAEQGTVTGELPLTPIQHWFFGRDLPERHHWNMPVLLVPREPLEAAALEGAVRALVEHHDALRLRFARGADGEWTQRNAGTEGEPPVERIDLAGLPEAEQTAALALRCAELQGSLELEGGPLFRAVYFDMGADRPGRLLLLAHHLVTDAASWRVLAEDLQTAYEQLRRGEEVVLPLKTTSFREWAGRLEAHTRSGALDGELAFWSDPAREGVARVPVDADGPDTEESARVVSLSLEEEETRALLQEVTAAYRTQINDVLLAALARAWTRWTGEERLLVELEGHGREELFPEVDLSRTVGWFSTAFPVLLDLRGAPDEGASLKAVKEQLRAVPARGIGYGLLRYLGSGEARERLGALPRAEISFNYLGQFAGTFSGETFFDLAPETPGAVRSPRGERSNLLEINGMVAEGERGGSQLHLQLGYSTGRHREATVQRLAEAFVAELRALIAHCTSGEAGGYTPSDFPLAALDQAALDELLGGERGIEDVYPLTPMQEGMLFHTLLAPEGGAYVGQFSYDLVGEMNEEALDRAWRGAVQRHAVMRTGFAWAGSDRPFQVVRREVELAIRREDWRGLSQADQEARLEAYLAADREAGFDPVRPPLMRIAIFRLSDERRRLVWTHHHLLLDGWSLPLVFRDIVALYDAFSEGREPSLAPNRAYRDYIAWLGRQDLAAAERFWRESLAGFTAPTPLALERPGGTGRGRGFDRLDTRLSLESSVALQEMARHHGLTQNTLVQGAWGLLLARYAGEEDVVFGSTVSGRPPEVEGVEGMVGLFINTLPVRVRTEADATVVEWLRGVQERQARLREFEYAPLARIQRWSEVQGAPLFESILVFENYPVEEALGEGPERPFDVETVGGLEQTDYPITVTAGVVGNDRALHLMTTYAADRFDAEGVERMLGHLAALLEAFAARPEGRLGEVSLVSAEEREQVLRGWNDTARGYPEIPAHELFAAQAARTPGAAAVAFGGETVTYAGLELRANRIANHLRALGVGPETRVGVCLERTPELVAALLGILKAGGAYLPLDPAYPAERLAFMVADAGAPVVLTQSHLADRLPAGEARVVRLDAERERIDAAGDAAPEVAVSPENLSHVIYTSGSTGRPKGTMIRHRSVAVLLHWLRDTVPAEERAASLGSTSISFDVSVAEIFGTLCWGGTLLLVENSLELGALPAGTEVRLATMVPSAAAELLRTGGIPQSVRAFNLGGEALPNELAQGLYALGHVEVVRNFYGPTEDTTYSTWSVVPKGGSRVTVGRPVADTRAYVLDARLEPVPVGVIGELYLAGDGLARGYLDRPELTAERFLPCPFGEPGSRMYRVMDRVRWTAAGELEYLGRTDHQVKVRGFRVELGEIEAALREHPSVREAAVVVREDRAGERQIVAYAVAAEGAEAPASELRGWLREQLPEYMVPAFFVALDALPLTPNGKLDRRALPAPEGAGEAREYVAPRTPVEEILTEILADVLGIERVGVHDDFFALGGHSLLATRVISRVRRQFGVEVTLRMLFEAPTVAELAERLAEHQPAVEGVDELELAAELERLSELSEEEVLRLLREG